MFIPLHVKSSYSLGAGTAPVEAFVEWAVRRGLPAMALTDLENMYGQIRYHVSCKREGIRAITGVELRAGFDGRRENGLNAGRLVLLARDLSGYRNLCRIVSGRRVRAGSTSPRATGEDPIDTLVGRSDGLFVMTDHLPVLRRLTATGIADREQLRLLVVRPGSMQARESETIQAARDLGVRIVADVDAVTISPDHQALHTLLVAIHRGITVSEAIRQNLIDPLPRSLPEPDEVSALFADRPELVEETQRIADACTLDLDDIRAQAGQRNNAGVNLSRECALALERGRRSGKWIGQEYEERIARELTTIAKTGFETYFLAVFEIVREAHRREILTSGRGSAAGSLVAHVLGITDVDPIEHNLYFERFLHELRNQPPDIDVDVDSRRRDELIDWVYRHFGRDRVAAVSTMQTFQLRSALRELLRAHGVAPRSIDRILEVVPHSDVAEEVLSQVRTVAPPHLGTVLGHVPELVGLPHHISVHPGGLVIVPDEIDARLPLERAPKGTIVTQYDLRSVEAAGLLKIDLLGNRALAVIAETVQLAAAQPDVMTIAPSLDDPGTLDALDRADTIGCFQVESPAMRSVLRRLPIRRFDDVIAALAIVRPGAASGGAKRAFLDEAHSVDVASGIETARSPSTRTAILYEEDILRILSDTAGIPVVEADVFRAAIVDADDDDETIDRLGHSFIGRAVANGRDEVAAREAWSVARRFAAYSFSRAHAASYALIAFGTVFLQTHHPIEYTCALLNHYGGAYPLRTIAAAAQRRDVRITAPSVQRSHVVNAVETGGEGRSVRLGLGMIKSLQRTSVTSIVASREHGGAYHDMGDLLDRVKLRTPEIRALVSCGACDELAPLSKRGFPFVHDALVAGLSGKGNARTLEDRIAFAAALTEEGDKGARLARYRALTRIRNELTYLDMHVTAHPMAVLRSDSESAGCVPTSDLGSHDGRFVRVAGILAASRRVTTAKGDRMQFLTLEDEHGTVEILLFPAIHRRTRHRITTPGPYLVEGYVSSEGGDLHIRGTAVQPFHERHTAPVREGVQSRGRPPEG